MGMFDSVIARCPECGTPNEFQSKGGPCRLERYHLRNAPPLVLADVHQEPVMCDGCGQMYHVYVQLTAVATVVPGRPGDEEEDQDG